MIRPDYCSFKSINIIDDVVKLGQHIVWWSSHRLRAQEVQVAIFFFSAKMGFDGIGSSTTAVVVTLFVWLAEKLPQKTWGYKNVSYKQSTVKLLCQYRKQQSALFDSDTKPSYRNKTCLKQVI